MNFAARAAPAEATRTHDGSGARRWTVVSCRIRSGITRNSRLATATSTIWKITYRACVTTLAPILISFDGTRPDVVGKVRPGSDNGSQIGAIQGHSDCRSAKQKAKSALPITVSTAPGIAYVRWSAVW